MNVYVIERGETTGRQRLTNTINDSIALGGDQGVGACKTFNIYYVIKKENVATVQESLLLQTKCF